MITRRCSGLCTSMFLLGFQNHIYPPLLDSIPPVLLLSAYFARKWYLARKLRVHGIGKGGEDRYIEQQFVVLKREGGL